MTDILDTVSTEEELPKLTQAEYDRAAKLNAAITKAQAELDILKDRIKAEHTKKGTFVHGKVIVIIGSQDRKDLIATAKKFPMETYPDHWVTPDPILDVTALEKSDFIVKPTPTLSIKFAEPDES